jgi:hypothetical protein
MEWFLNQTTHISNCGGLRLYIVPLINTTNLPEFVPDEIALLQYRSADLYHSFYATPIGKYYQALHARFFNMTRSLSIVPQTYENTIQIDHAYCVPNCNFSWTDLFSAVSIVENDLGIGLSSLDFDLRKAFGNFQPEAIVVGVYQYYVKV